MLRLPYSPVHIDYAQRTNSEPGSLPLTLPKQERSRSFVVCSEFLK